MKIIERNKKKEFWETVAICLMLGSCLTVVGIYALLQQEQTYQQEIRR